MMEPVPTRDFDFSEAESAEQLLCLVVGAASTCWESLDNAGAFQDQKALYIVKKAMEMLPHVPIFPELVHEQKTFAQELTALINKHSMENRSNTPDWILMEFLVKSLEAWELATGLRDRYYGDGNRAGT